jgi:hypothetical protein
VGQAGPRRCAVVKPVERIPAHNFPEQDRYVDTKDLSRPKVALCMVSGGLGVQTRVTVGEVVKPVAMGPLGLRNGRTARAGLGRRAGLLRVRFSKADRRLPTTFPPEEGLENEAINTPLGLGLLRGEVFLLILKTGHRFTVHVRCNGVQIKGAEIGHRPAANELAEERVDVKDTAYPGDHDRCRGGNRQRGESRGGHHDTGSAVINRHLSCRED